MDAGNGVWDKPWRHKPCGNAGGDQGKCRQDCPAGNSAQPGAGSESMQAASHCQARSERRIETIFETPFSGMVTP